MERIDDLQYKGIKIIQNTEFPGFTEDSVLLANFLRAKPGDRVVDLGSGTGILCILGQAKTGADFLGIEKQAELVELAKKSAKMNAQEINFFEMDIADIRREWKAETADAVIFNPPYFTEGEVGPDSRRAMTRHADGSALALFLDSASFMLKNRGNVFFCYPAEKLTDCFCKMRQFRLEPKRLQLVAGKKDGKPRLALLMGKKNAGEGIVIEPVCTYEDLVPCES